MPHGKQSKKNASGAGTIRKKTVRRGGREYTYWEARYTVGSDPGTGRQKQKEGPGRPIRGAPGLLSLPRRGLPRQLSCCFSRAGSSGSTRAALCRGVFR